MIESRISDKTKTNTFSITEEDNITYHFSFYDNNRVKHFLTKKNGKNHGIEKEYDSTGRCKFSCRWVEGKNVGWPSRL